MEWEQEFDKAADLNFTIWEIIPWQENVPRYVWKKIKITGWKDRKAAALNFSDKTSFYVGTFQKSGGLTEERFFSVVKIYNFFMRFSAPQ